MKIKNLVQICCLIMFTGTGFATDNVKDTDSASTVEASFIVKNVIDNATQHFPYANSNDLNHSLSDKNSTILLSCPIGQRKCCEPEFCYCARHCL